jgi:hypothetical protein
MPKEKPFVGHRSSWNSYNPMGGRLVIIKHMGGRLVIIKLMRGRLVISKDMRGRLDICRLFIEKHSIGHRVGRRWLERHAKIIYSNLHPN